MGSLVLVYGLGLVVMLLGGVVIQALKPTRHVDIFAALHNRWGRTSRDRGALAPFPTPVGEARHRIVAPRTTGTVAGGKGDGDEGVVTTVWGRLVS